jgi:1,4-alpha-glucan branching enzyme
MGEEFAADTPFLFFCDFEPHLAAAVTEGRRDEFRSFANFADADVATQIPDPSAPATFARSKLDWRSVGRSPHAEQHAFYRELLALRCRAIVPLVPRVARVHRRFRRWADTALTVTWPLDDGRTLRLDANLGDRDAAGYEPVAGNVVYATPSIDLAGNALPPWSVVWRIDAARDEEGA